MQEGEDNFVWSSTSDGKKLTCFFEDEKLNGTESKTEGHGKGQKGGEKPQMSPEAILDTLIDQPCFYRVQNAFLVRKILLVSQFSCLFSD